MTGASEYFLLLTETRFFAASTFSLPTMRPVSKIVDFQLKNFIIKK